MLLDFFIVIIYNYNYVEVIDVATIVYQRNKKTGVVYAYESESYWDKEKKQPRSRRRYLGKVDPETNEIIPMVTAQTPGPKKRGPRPSVACMCRFSGATWLLDQIGEQTGVEEDLRRCFPDTWMQILSVVYYLTLEDSDTMSRFSKWASTHTHPYGEDLPSQRISDLFQSITEDSRQRFFRAQSKRREEKEYLFYDTTSISSYSETLRQVKYGYNKEHDPLPQINLGLLYGQKTMLPVCYRKLAGNIPDVKTVFNTLNELSYLDIRKINLVMDRGFYSESNINEMFERHYKFLIGARLTMKLISQELDKVREELKTRKHYSSKHGIYYDSFLSEWVYSRTKKQSGEVITDKRKIYVHLYYNAAREAEDRSAFNVTLDTLENELLSGKRDAGHEKQYEKYYHVKQTPVRGISIAPKQEAIDKAERNYGYFALMSNGVKDPLEALELYRAKDLIEKAFGNLKERLNMRRQYVSSEDSLDGKLFVQFVALIYLSRIQKTMLDNDLYKTYTLRNLLDELDVIQRFDYPGKAPVYSEVTVKQAALFSVFGAVPPS